MSATPAPESDHLASLLPGSATSGGLPPPSVLLPLLRESLEREGQLTWRVAGRSMAPTLPEGCEIAIAPLPPSLRRGALVVFAQGNDLVVHRLVHRARGQWIAQGDGAPLPDAPLGRERMLGIVTGARHEGRPCWPTPRSRLLTPFWLARYHLLRTVRWMARRLPPS